MKRCLEVGWILVLLLGLGKAEAACNVTVTGIAFGAYDVFAAPSLDGTGTVSVSCDQAPPPNVTIAIGRSPTSGQFNPRQMRSAGGGDLLNYNVFTDAARTLVWGDGTPGTTVVIVPKVKKNEAPRVTTIYARVPPGQNVSVGSYSDTLTVTILY